MSNKQQQPAPQAPVADTPGPQTAGPAANVRGVSSLPADPLIGVRKDEATGTVIITN